MDKGAWRGTGRDETYMSEDTQNHGQRTEELCGTLRCGRALKVRAGIALCALLGTVDGRRTCNAKAEDERRWI